MALQPVNMLLGVTISTACAIPMSTIVMRTEVFQCGLLGVGSVIKPSILSQML